MFRGAYQSGWLSILYSCGASPLELWGMQVKNGYIRRVTDEEVKSLALEISGTNVATTFIYTPKDPKTVLAINLPFLIMIIKNMKRYFTFEITILDDKRMHRRFRISNFQSTTKVRPFCTTMPIGLAGGWNQIQFNLADFTRRAYGSNYIETTRMQIHANCRIRRIYFADRLYTDDDLPAEYKLLFPARRDSHVTDSSVHEKQPNGHSQTRISMEAVPAEEPPAFHADTEQTHDEDARQTTPVASVAPSRTVVAPDGASRVQIEIVAKSEDEEANEQEMDFEYEDDEALTTEHEDEEALTTEHEDEEALTTEHEDAEEELITEHQETGLLSAEEEEEEKTNVEATENEEAVSELQA